MPVWGSEMRVADGELGVVGATPIVRIGSRAESMALYAAFFGWLALVCLVGAHHEPWRDESDLWLFVRDAAPSEWWTYLKHQGSPGLWHLLILPLAKLQLPYASITWLNIAIVGVGVAIFLRCAPFPIWVKLLFPFGVLPLYEYGVVARSYGLSFTLFLAACATLTGRRSRPIATGVLLALLANTNVHSLVLASGLGLYWLLTTLRARKPGDPLLPREVAIGMAIAAAGGLLTVLLLMPPDDAQRFWLRWRRGKSTLSVFCDAFFPKLPWKFGGILGVGMLAAVVLYLRRRTPELALLAWSAGILLCFFTLVYPGALRHAGFLTLTVVAVLWLERSGAPPSARWRSAITLLFAVSLGFSAAEGLRLSRLDYREPFSGSRDAGEFLRTLDLDSAMVVAQLAPYGGAILPYLPIRQMWYPGTKEYGSYVHWNEGYSFGMWETPETGYLETRASFPGVPPIIYISIKPIKRPENMGLTLRYETAEPPRDLKADEHFFIYTTEDVRPAPHVDRVAN